GMEQALDSLKNSLGSLPPFKYRLASSSAAGGLKMITIGLVKELTVEAAKRAALGAGAKLVGIFANRSSALSKSLAGASPPQAVSVVPR
ncbi:MAG: glutamate mutase L, partial [Rhodospirillales bacterium]|nr:glutamate mutase L [Rhodospirillales bacterium]